MKEYTAKDGKKIFQSDGGGLHYKLSDALDEEASNQCKKAAIGLTGASTGEDYRNLGKAFVFLVSHHISPWKVLREYRKVYHIAVLAHVASLNEENALA